MAKTARSLLDETAADRPWGPFGVVRIEGVPVPLYIQEIEHYDIVNPRDGRRFMIHCESKPEATFSTPLQSSFEVFDQNGEQVVSGPWNLNQPAEVYRGHLTVSLPIEFYFDEEELNDPSAG